jgi:hypothetical protein
MRLGVVLATGAAMWAGMAVASASVGASTVGHFKTPSHNVVCEYAYGVSGRQPSVVCSIRSGLKPAPPHIDCRGAGDYTDHIVALKATGRATEPSCAGDPGPLVFEASARVLHYGDVWSHAGLRCNSELKGLTCTNRSGHGFVLSRAHSRRF